MCVCVRGRCSEDLRERDIAQQPLLGAAVRAVLDAGHLAVVLVGLVQTLVTVHVHQGQLLHTDTHNAQGGSASTQTHTTHGKGRLLHTDTHNA